MTARYWHSGAQTAAVKKIVRSAQVSPAEVRTTRGVTVLRGAVWPNVVAARIRRAGFHVEVSGDLLTATRPDADGLEPATELSTGGRPRG